MNTLDNRQKGFEAKFAHDEELRFKASARRNKLLGQWVAEQLGLQGDEADNYAKSVIKADLEEPGEDDVFRKIRKDLDDGSITLSDEDLRQRMADLMDTAISQIEGEA